MERVVPNYGPSLSVPARAAVSKHVLPIAEGEYQLEVDALGYVNRFSLLVTGASIELIPMSSVLAPHVLGGGFVEPEFTTFWRFPPRSLAFYCRRLPLAVHCDEVAESIVRDLGFTPHFFPSLGHPPYPEYHNEGPNVYGELQVRYFLYERDEDFARLRALICSFPPAYFHSYPQAAVNWRNEVVRVPDCPR
jgi:hypothetical protein